MHEPHKLGADAHRLVQEFVALPEQDRVRSNELLVELECVIAEFKRLRPAPGFKRPTPSRVVETLEPRLCSICEQMIDSESWNHFETEGAAYHRKCYSAATERD